MNQDENYVKCGPMQLKARVNWHNNNKLGVTYVEGEAKGGSNIFHESEVTWLTTPTQSMRDKFNLANLSDDELRERLKKIRKERRLIIQNQDLLAQPKSKQTRKRRTTKSKTAASEAIANLGNTEKDILRQLLEEGNLE